MKTIHNFSIDQNLYDLIEEIIARHPKVQSETFWQGFVKLISDLSPENRRLLAKRDELQSKIDTWHRQHPGRIQDMRAYKQFLHDIGYLLDEPEDFKASTANVDREIAEQAGPQLVVPIGNARYALNAANARWGSLYDALYGSNVIAQNGELAPGNTYNPKRGSEVIRFARNFLNESIPLEKGSHQDVLTYRVVNARLQAELNSGEKVGLQTPEVFVGYNGKAEAPESLLFLHNGLHFDIIINPSSPIGSQDPAGIQDIIMEAALTTIMDLEDSTSAVDGADKAHVYRNWLGLMDGSLTEEVSKGGKTFTRRMNPDRHYQKPDGSGEFSLGGRSLMFIRNVGHHMTCPAVQDAEGHDVYEGILDAIMTGLIAPFDLNRHENKNSRSGSIYIVKPKMHGPEEVRFTAELMRRVEELTVLPAKTLKIGVMDEERRTSVNLKACIKEVADRIVFINTGFLDRTGDEIHTAMQAGAMVRKGDMKHSVWLDAYEKNNVSVGLQCGLPGHAQIGKGMWAMTDLMAEMLAQKINHPRAGASTAWVPSPTAATLHALHYHQVNVFEVQERLRHETPPADRLDQLLSIPVAEKNDWSAQEIQEELDNNCQGILGYVVRWIEQGIGCSKVPDIHNVALMEDRATLRISSQHIANWLLHGITNEEQVRATLKRMAAVVDQQNANDPAYLPMQGHFDDSPAFLAACDLIFKGVDEANGYTENALHHWRRVAKKQN